MKLKKELNKMAMNKKQNDKIASNFIKLVYLVLAILIGSFVYVSAQPYLNVVYTKVTTTLGDFYLIKDSTTNKLNGYWFNPMEFNKNINATADLKGAMKIKPYTIQDMNQMIGESKIVNGTKPPIGDIG